MGLPLDKTATVTIELLEYRLRRIEFVLSGNEEAQSVLQQAAAQGKGFTTHARITRLEEALSKLSSKSTIVDQLLRLREDTCDEAPLSSTNFADRCPLSRSVPAHGARGNPNIAHNSGTPRSCQLLRLNVFNRGVAINDTAKLADSGRRTLGFLDSVRA